MAAPAHVARTSRPAVCAADVTGRHGSKAIRRGLLRLASVPDPEIHAFVEAIQPLILIAVFIAFFYFLAIRPQKKRQMELRRIRDNLKAGDQIVTLFGMYATVTEVEDAETILVEISEDTEIRIAASSVASIVPDPNAAPASELPTKAD